MREHEIAAGQFGNSNKAQPSTGSHSPHMCLKRYLYRLQYHKMRSVPVNPTSFQLAEALPPPHFGCRAQCCR